MGLHEPCHIRRTCNDGDAMDMMPTTVTQYYYETENFGDDIHYCVYKKIIINAEYGEYSYSDWVETFYDEDKAIRFVMEKMGGQGIHI